MNPYIYTPCVYLKRRLKPVYLKGPGGQIKSVFTCTVPSFCLGSVTLRGNSFGAGFLGGSEAMLAQDDAGRELDKELSEDWAAKIRNILFSKHLGVFVTAPSKTQACLRNNNHRGLKYV